MDEADTGGARRSLLRAGAVAWALRVTALAVILSVVAAHYLSRLGDAGDPRAATRVAQASLDPETTGSIATARQMRLDPCTLLRR